MTAQVLPRHVPGVLLLLYSCPHSANDVYPGFHKLSGFHPLSCPCHAATWAAASRLKREPCRQPGARDPHSASPQATSSVPEARGASSGPQGEMCSPGAGEGRAAGQAAADPPSLGTEHHLPAGERHRDHDENKRENSERDQPAPERPQPAGQPTFHAAQRHRGPCRHGRLRQV